MKTSLFLVIPNPIAASDLLRTNYIQYLVDQYRVVVINPTIDSETAVSRGYFQSPDLSYVKLLSANPKFWEFLKFLRISLVNEFDYLISIRHWYKRPNYLENRKRRLLRFLGKPFAKLLTADFFTNLERLLAPKARAFRQLAAEHKPALIATATPGFDGWEAEIINEARRLRIPTVAVNFRWDNLTMNCKHIRKTNYLVAWNEIMKQEAIDIHRYSADRVFVSGTPRFDPYFGNIPNEPTREEFLKSKGLNPAYRTIFHTTVTKAYPFQKKYIHDLIKLREDKKIPYVNLFVRIHPLDIYENYREFFAVPDLYIEKSGSGTDGRVEMNYKDLLNLKYSLKYTDLNINYASTISIEACVFNKPIINIGFLGRFALAYEFNHYEPIYRSGAVRLAKTDEDLPRLINFYLENPEADREERRQIVQSYVGFTDGLSYKRSVDFLDKIISNTKNQNGKR